MKFVQTHWLQSPTDTLEAMVINECVYGVNGVYFGTFDVLESKGLKLSKISNQRSLYIAAIEQTEGK